MIYKVFKYKLGTSRSVGMFLFYMTIIQIYVCIIFTGSEKCPVLSFEKYISKLNPDCYRLVKTVEHTVNVPL